MQKKKMPSKTRSRWVGRRMKIFLLRLVRNKVLQHTLFWGLSYFILYRLFAYSKEVTLTDLLYAFLFHFSIWIAVYINLLLLIPRLLKPQQYHLYIPLLGITLLFGAVINTWTFNYLSDWLFPGYYFISYYDFNEILQFILVYLVITTLIKLSKGWFQLNEKERKISRLQREKLDAELKALKTQIDPHFLFNSLNNLYSLALDSDSRTPDVILKLAESMRYMLYECGDKFVPLEKELQYLKNYLELQQLRTDLKSKIRFEVKGEVRDQQVPPLLFIPFVENAFKHGIKGSNEAAYTNIQFEIKPDLLRFKAENNKEEKSKTLIKKTAGGIGLNNIKRRLEILYPNKHQLQIVDGIQHFSVDLKLELL